MERAWLGYLCVVAAAVLWATSGVAGKALFAGGLTPLELVQARATLSAILLGPVLAAAAPRLLRVRLRDVPFLALLGGVAMAAVQLTYFTAIRYIQVAAAILLEYLSPALIAAFSLLFWKERPSVPKLLALALAVGGCYLVVGGYDLDLLRLNRYGIAAGLGSAVAFAAYTLLGERAMHRYSPWTVLFYALFFAALSLHLLAPPFLYLRTPWSAARWGLVAWVAVGGTVVPFGLYLTGVNYLRSTRASITATLEPIAAAFVAFFALGEALTLPQAGGGALVLAAVVMLQWGKEADERAPAAIRERGGRGAGEA